jgi:hypothetical protein
MSREKASDLILRSRLKLERIRCGHIDHGLINHMAQVCIISSYIASTGHGRIPQARFDMVEQALGQTLIDFDLTGTWHEPNAVLLEGLTDVVNEYDRMLCTVRLELFAKASHYLDRMMITTATEENSNHQT